jgi:hypothetical protein
VDAPVVQGLAGADVADADDDGRVEQHGPDRGAALAGKASPERGHRERLA